MQPFKTFYVSHVKSQITEQQKVAKTQNVIDINRLRPAAESM